MNQPIKIEPWQSRLLEEKYKPAIEKFDPDRRDV